MKKITALLTAGVFWLWMIVPAPTQTMIVGKHRVTAATGPTLIGRTYCADAYVSSESTATCGGGGALTTNVGDVIVVNCSATGYLTITSINASDSKSNSYTQGTFEQPGLYYYSNQQLNYSVVSSSGSTNFICITAPTNTVHISMTVMQYRGLAGTLNTSLFGKNGPNSSAFLTSAFTTTARALIVACAGAGQAGVWTAGNIGGSAGTLVGVSGATLGTSSTNACEAQIASSSISSGTAAMTATGSLGDYGYGVLAFNY
jgi:hypothetical protein